MGRKNNSDHAKIRIMQKKCIGFGQFDQKICSDYANSDYAYWDAGVENVTLYFVLCISSNVLNSFLKFFDLKLTRFAFAEYLGYDSGARDGNPGS